MNTHIYIHLARFLSSCKQFAILAFFVCLILFSTNLYSQNLVSFHQSSEDGETQKYGYKDKKTGIILIPAHYSQALDFEQIKDEKKKLKTFCL